MDFLGAVCIFILILLPQVRLPNNEWIIYMVISCENSPHFNRKIRSRACVLALEAKVGLELLEVGGREGRRRQKERRRRQEDRGKEGGRMMEQNQVD